MSRRGVPPPKAKGGEPRPMSVREILISSFESSGMKLKEQADGSFLLYPKPAPKKRRRKANPA